MNNIATELMVKANMQKHIAILCYNLYVTIDNQVLNKKLEIIKPVLRCNSYCYMCNGKYKTIKWIKENGINVLGIVTL